MSTLVSSLDPFNKTCTEMEVSLVVRSTFPSRWSPTPTKSFELLGSQIPDGSKKTRKALEKALKELSTVREEGNIDVK